jgi:ABC-type amino acid transport substrate-binding protein
MPIEKQKELDVMVSNFPPMIMKKGDEFVGFEIELWNNIAREARFNFKYRESSFKNILDSLKKCKADVGLAGITVNEEREKFLDFSHHILESGLLILIPKNKKISIINTIKYFLSGKYKTILFGIFSIMVFIVLFGNIVWLIERGSGVFNPKYSVGVMEAFWWSIVTMSTVGYGDFVPHTIWGRVFGAVVIVCGYMIFGFFIAEMASVLTIRKMKETIKGFRDLAGKKVVTVKHTTSVALLEKINAKIVYADDIEKACKKLKNSEVDAVVFDAPVILHFLKEEDKKEDFEIVGDIFNHQSYGVATQNKSELIEAINLAILKLKENGTYDALYLKWFGDDLKLR